MFYPTKPGKIFASPSVHIGQMMDRCDNIHQDATEPAKLLHKTIFK